MVLFFYIRLPADNEICKDVGESPQNYLVPHPTDCRKFFSCQLVNDGKSWIANQMSCPTATLFDNSMRLCTFLRTIPTCRPGTCQELRQISVSPPADVLMFPDALRRQRSHPSNENSRVKRQARDHDESKDFQMAKGKSSSTFRSPSLLALCSCATVLLMNFV